MKTVEFCNSKLPAIGQGTSHLTSEDALRLGIDLGMTVIDTAEVYGTEELVGRAIKGQRERLFLVSKIWPTNAANMQQHCEASLKRLGTDVLDLYLLHWPEGITNFEPVVAGFEHLCMQGKIRYWGVSNFSVEQMEELLHVARGCNCKTNQVLYNILNRGIEEDMLPWCSTRDIPIMAYSPLGGGNPLGKSAAFALSWIIRHRNVLAIPKANSVAHVRENASALELELYKEELQ